MKTIVMLLAACGLATQVAQAQVVPPVPAPVPTPADTAWRTSLKVGLNLNESLLSDNWKGGGASSVGLSGLFNAQAHYRQGPHSWDNEADFLYAAQYTRGQSYRKTNDRLWLDTKYGRALSAKWNAFVSLNLLSQFAPGYDFSDGPPRLISSFLAPGYLTNAYGFEYRPNARFSLRLSPFAPRLTIVRDPARFQNQPTDVIYGVNPGHSTRWEILAAQILAELEQPLGPNANLKARYLLFSNYGSFKARDINQRLDLTITAKIYGLLSLNFQSTVLYQRDQDPGIQFSQGLGLGLLLTRQKPAAPAK